ncbi:MAG: ABC-type transport auxiliary lipoprotein family protein [Gammaproteobacteria bacterium]
MWLALFLSGCAGTVPDDHFYRLATLPVEQAFERPPLVGVLRVERVEAVGLLRDRALLYSHADRPQQLQRHHYHHWIGPPPVLVRDQLVQYLRDSDIADLVATDPMGRDADLYLHLELRDFSRRLHAGGRAAVRVELGLVAQPADRESPQLVRRYAREVTAANGSPAAAVTAFDQALAEIYGELARDLMQMTGQ